MPAELQRARGRPHPVTRAALLALFAALVLLRIPSLAQPPGGDQGLYAYAGTRVLAGEVLYRDAWDQKPPGLHLAYAAMWAVWPHDAVVAAVDLALACLTAVGLLALGRRLAPATSTGLWAAGLFLLLSNPALGRLGGVRTRAQAEVFIGALVTGALLLVWPGLSARARRATSAPMAAATFAAGLTLGLAFLFKYNAGAYLLPAAVAVAAAAHGSSRKPLAATGRGLLVLGAGFALVVVLTLGWFLVNGALTDLYHATITYNMFYSGETYTSGLAFVRYLVTFPVRHAWLDSLWWLGGLGTVALMLAALRAPHLWIVPAWVVAACVSIAVNGGRGLPQYFVQASPALALATGWLMAWCWQRVRVAGRILLVAMVAFGILRVSNFDKAFASAWWDTQYLAGQIDRTTYLERFGAPASGDKYSALANEELGRWLAAETRPGERVLVFGFSPYALVVADRASASRFYWSRPVIVDFLEGTPRYGPTGLLEELDRHAPRVVVLQRRDWDPDGPDSATYFLNHPALAAWLSAHYEAAGELGNYLLWRRR